MQLPHDGVDESCEVVLVVKDGKFKVHRKALSEASPFFEKLLNSDMKESKEGVVRLEMFTKSVMSKTIEFVYTGNIHILDADEARELVVIADYLFLTKLKVCASRYLLQKLNITILNSLSTLRIADTYHLEELYSKTKTFILANINALFTENREDVLNMSSKELTIFISSDELIVNVEEDVFSIILSWIHHDIRKRHTYFAELFSHVQLLYISRDYLCNDVVTNKLVEGNEGCLDLVHKAIGILESKNVDNFLDYLHVTPRKAFQTPVLIANTEKYLMCYLPRENSWYTLGGEIPLELKGDRLFSCNSKLYSTRIESVKYPREVCRLHMSCYDPYSSTWISLPVLEGNAHCWQIFVNNKDEMFALFSETSGGNHFPTWWIRNGRGSAELTPVRQGVEEGTEDKNVSFIMQYKSELHKWEEIASFNYLDLRQDFIIVAHDNFIYLIGRILRILWRGREYEFPHDVERYDLNTDQWEKLPGLHQIARRSACGAAANRKVIIAEGCQCEIYDEDTNEWHFIEDLEEGSYSRRIINLVTVDDQLYALFKDQTDGTYTVKHYDTEKKKWSPNELMTKMSSVLDLCSMRIFRGWLNNFSMESLTSVPIQDTPKHYCCSM